mgnify:CR=1 FL=1
MTRKSLKDTIISTTHKDKRQIVSSYVQIPAGGFVNSIDPG